MFLIFDLETSGFISPNYHFYHPKQGRILQIAGILLDEKFNEQAIYSTYLRVENNIEIHQKAFETNHITKEQCIKYGSVVELALCTLEGMLARSEYQIAHNIRFDIDMIHHEERNIFGNDRMQFRNPICTMEEMTPICMLPNTGNREGYKWPKLEEAYNHLFGKDETAKLPQFHNALEDCRAVTKIFKYLYNEGFIKR